MKFSFEARKKDYNFLYDKIEAGIKKEKLWTPPVWFSRMCRLAVSKVSFVIVVALTRASERANERRKEHALGKVADSNIRRSRGCSVEAARSRARDASKTRSRSIAIDRYFLVFCVDLLS